MTNKEFQHLLDMAISRGNLKEVGLDKVYVALTWWDDVFLPLINLDGSWRTGEKICVFGSKEDACNKWHNGLPCAFWIAKDAVRIERATHRPLTLKPLYLMTGDKEYAPRKFLISNSPRNVFVDINPFKTRIIRNREGETMLCFYAEDRDSGEMVPFERMTEKDIIVIDDHKGPGEYKYGEWKDFEQDNTPVDIGAGMCEKAPENDKAPECDKAPVKEVAK